MLHRNYFEEARGVVGGVKIDSHCCFYTLCRGIKSPNPPANTALSASRLQACSLSSWPTEVSQLVDDSSSY